MLPLPKRSTDPSSLADWLELTALLAPDANSSAGDLDAALRRAAVLDEPRIETTLAAVFAELMLRETSAGDGYPFSITGATVGVRSDAWTARTSYLLCLALSAMTRDDQIGVRCRPERVFEELATAAAGNFLSGTAVRFGFPRNGLPSSFKAAVQELSDAWLSEGGGFSQRDHRWNKDYGVDIVGWRDAGDGRLGKLILFGACAAGGDWKDKLGELNADEWCKEWFADPLSSRQVVQAYFVARRLSDPGDWRTLYRRGGIPFDRCRIARWAPDLPRSQVHGSGRRWTRSVLWAVGRRK